MQHSCVSSSREGNCCANRALWPCDRLLIICQKNSWVGPRLQAWAVEKAFLCEKLTSLCKGQTRNADL